MKYDKFSLRSTWWRKMPCRSFKNIKLNRTKQSDKTGGSDSVPCYFTYRSTDLKYRLGFLPFKNLNVHNNQKKKTAHQLKETESMEFMNCDFIDTGEQGERLLLLGHTDGTTATAGGLGVLTTHTQTGQGRGEKKKVSTKHQHQHIPH